MALVRPGRLPNIPGFLGSQREQAVLQHNLARMSPADAAGLGFVWDDDLGMYVAKSDGKSMQRTMIGQQFADQQYKNRMRDLQAASKRGFDPRRSQLYTRNFRQAMGSLGRKPRKQTNRAGPTARDPGFQVNGRRISDPGASRDRLALGGRRPAPQSPVGSGGYNDLTPNQKAFMRGMDDNQKKNYINNPYGYTPNMLAQRFGTQRLDSDSYGSYRNQMFDQNFDTFGPYGYGGGI